MKITLEEHGLPGSFKLWWKAEHNGLPYGQLIHLNLPCNDLEQWIQILKNNHKDTMEILQREIDSIPREIKP